jgi:curli production assembly/transport component CsgG
MTRELKSGVAAAALALVLSGCAVGSANDPFSRPATMVPATSTGIVLDKLPPPARPLDVAIYSFPDLTGQNKENDNFAEFSHALTQGGADILTDVVTKAGNGRWFDVVERSGLQALLQERQIIQNTRNSILGKKAEGLPALRFAGIILQGGVIGYDTNQTTGGLGANYLGIGGNTNYREDVVTVALRAVSVSTGRVVASVTTTKTIYSVLLDGSIFKFVAVDKLLQVEGGFSRNSPVTLGVREAVQLAVYSLIFEGAKHHLWQFKDPAAGAAFMAELEKQQRAVDVQPITSNSGPTPPPPAAPPPTPPPAAAESMPVAPPPAAPKS